MMGYIQQMGFDAVWMSPYSQQGPDNMESSGYHGEQ
jgi:glycosidase